MDSSIDVPVTTADIDAAWLNRAAGGAIGTVTALETEPFGQGVGILGELARLHLTYEPGHTGPATLVAKCQSPAAENQFLAQAMGFYLREVSFYREVADKVSVRVPQAYVAESGPDGLPFVLILEDIAGARTPDQIAGITVDEADRILRTVARLHAEFWDSPSLETMTWLPPMNNPLYQGAQAMALERLPSFLDRFGERIGADMCAHIERGCNNYIALLEHMGDRDNVTFTHTDCRAENYLFGGPAGEDEITMIDFQLSTRYVGPWDAANLIGGSMDPDSRRQHETALMESYHSALVEHGVTGYSLEQCWDDYRMSLLQMCVASVAVSDLQGGNERGDELMDHLMLRPILSAAEQNVGELLDRFC